MAAPDPIQRGRAFYNPQAPLRSVVPEGARRDAMSMWYGTNDQGAGGAGIRRGAEVYTQHAPELVDAFGRPYPATSDPAWQSPREMTPEEMRESVGLITREVPIVTTQTGYAPTDVRSAIEALVIGLFDFPSQMSDTIMADSRVSATLASRTGGLLGRPVKHTIPPGFEDDEEAKLARKLWERNWDRIFPEAVASEFLRWGYLQAFAVAQNVWDTSKKYWIPETNVWHPRYTYYHWQYRCYVAIGMDGQSPITPSDGHWVLHAPHGQYRGWMRGSVWSIAPWWLARQYALRDWARYSERHGMPIILAKTPAAANPGQIAQFRAAMANLGQESVVQLPQGVEKQYSYLLELLEATDQGWQGFHQLIEQCNTEITLAIQGQNLTTEVKEGSFAAARVHADVRQALLEADARALERTIYQQIARPFAAVNFGRPEIAPRTAWELEPFEDRHTAAQTFQAVSQAVMALRRAGKQINNLEQLARDFGLNLQLGDVQDVPPLSGGSGGGGAGGGGGGGFGT